MYRRTGNPLIEFLIYATFATVWTFVIFMAYCPGWVGGSLYGVLPRMGGGSLYGVLPRMGGSLYGVLPRMGGGVSLKRIAPDGWGVSFLIVFFLFVMQDNVKCDLEIQVMQSNIINKRVDPFFVCRIIPTSPRSSHRSWTRQRGGQLLWSPSSEAHCSTCLVTSQFYRLAGCLTCCSRSLPSSWHSEYICIYTYI